MNLIPPDLDRCQVEFITGSFMTLGPRRWERCTETPHWLVTEKNPGKDGQQGAMTMCDICAHAFIERANAQAPETYTMEWIG